MPFEVIESEPLRTQDASSLDAQAPTASTGLAAPAKRPSVNDGWLYAAALLLLVLWGISRSTPVVGPIIIPGTAKITGTDPGMRVFVDDKQIRTEEIGKPISLHPGRHRLLVLRGVRAVRNKIFDINSEEENTAGSG